MYFKTQPDYGYKPFLVPGGGQEGRPYITRIAPQNDIVEFEWYDLADRDNDACTVFLTYDYVKYEKIRIKGNRCSIRVAQERDGAFYLETDDGRQSNRRPFRSGYYPGKVIAYNHPDDKQYDYSGVYLGSPSIVRLENGDLLASFDYFAVAQGMNLSTLLRSTDDGDTWKFVTDIFPSMWATLFTVGNRVYIATASKEYGDMQILESLDNGESWHGIVLDRGIGQYMNMGYHKAPTPVVKHNGRIYIAIEYGSWGKGKFMPAVYSIDENADFMDIGQWVRTPLFALEQNEYPLIVPWGAIEGNMVEMPDGTLVDILRHSQDKAVVLALDESNPAGKLRFFTTMDFAAAYTKFHIIKHDKKYYAMGNPSPYRNRLVLYVSDDALHWKEEKTLIDLSDYSAKLVGVQYPSFFIEDGVAYAVIRTAFNGADDFHNNNCITFHKFKLT